MAGAEGGQPGVLDLVDEPGIPRSMSQSSNAPGHGPPTSSTIGRSAARLSDSTMAGGTSPRGSTSSSGLWMSTTSGGSQALDQRDQRLRLRLGAGVLARRGEVRPVLEHPPLLLDPRRIRERVVRPPRRGREVAVEVDAGRVLPRAVEQPVRVRARARPPSASRAPGPARAGGARAGRSPPPRRAARRSADRRPGRRPPA